MGFFPVVDCGDPITLVHSQLSNVTGTSVGNTATYTCDEGFEVEGAIVSICESNGQWSDPDFECQGKIFSY